MIRKIIETTRGYRKRIFLMTILGMLYVASSLGFVWCSKEVIDIATGNSDKNFVVFASVMSLFLLFQNIFQISNNWISVRLYS